MENATRLKKNLVGTLILFKKSAAKNLWRQAFFLMHWPSLLYGYWFSNDYFLLAYAFGKRVIMRPKYFSCPIWIFKFCVTIISILSKRVKVQELYYEIVGLGVFMKISMGLQKGFGPFLYEGDLLLCKFGISLWPRKRYISTLGTGFKSNSLPNVICFI